MKTLGSRPFMRAYTSHLHALVAIGQLPLPSIPGRGLWALHVVADMCTEMGTGRLSMLVFLQIPFPFLRRAASSG